MTNYDVLVLDLDGTLLRSDGSVSRRNRQAIDRAREAGIEIIIATGRSLTESREPLQAIDHQGLVIAAGGSLLCEASTGRTLDRRAIPHDVVCEVARWLLEHDHRALILKDAHATGYDYLLVGNGDLDPASAWWFDRMGVTFREAPSIIDDLHPHDTVRAGAVACATRLEPLANRLRADLGERCFLQHWSAVTSSHAIGSSTHLLEVFDAQVSKWTMVQSYCSRRSGPASHETGASRGVAERNGAGRNASPTTEQRGVRIAAIGDGLNDVDLLANADMGIAMSNAGPEALAAAQRVTEHHDNDGVANAIDRLLSGEW